MTSLTGIVDTAPWHQIGKSGKGYCKFTVLDGKEKLHSCIAFDDGPTQLAKTLDDMVKVKAKIAMNGKVKDDMFYVSSFTLLDNINARQVSKWTPKPIPITPIEILMEKLTPQYVTKRMKELFKTDNIGKIVSKGFPQAEYKKLMAELWDEAAGKKI